MNKTPNYQLNQWEATDKVQRVDFNADNAKLDAALGALTSGKAEEAAFAALKSRVEQLKILRIVSGSYIGTGATEHTINMGLKPLFALVFPATGELRFAVITGERSLHCDTVATCVADLALPGSNVPVHPVDQGLYLRCDATWSDAERAEKIFNRKDIPYVWLAIGL